MELALLVAVALFFGTEIVAHINTRKLAQIKADLPLSGASPVRREGRSL